MTLKEISKEYRICAIRLRKELRHLRQMYRKTADPVKRREIEGEINRLAPILTQVNELAELTEHYYDRGYYRDKKYTF